MYIVTYFFVAPGARTTPAPLVNVPIVVFKEKSERI